MKSLMTEVMRVVVVMGIMVGIFLFVVNIFPELGNLSFAPNMVNGKIKDANNYLNEHKKDSSINIEGYVESFISDKISFERFKENMYKRAAKAEEDSEKVNSLFKRVTGGDLSKVASKYLMVDEDVLRGKK